MKIKMQARNLCDARRRQPAGGPPAPGAGRDRRFGRVPGGEGHDRGGLDSGEVDGLMRVGSDAVRKTMAQRLRREFESIEFKKGESETVDDFALRLPNIGAALNTVDDVVEKLPRVVPKRAPRRSRLRHQGVPTTCRRSPWSKPAGGCVRRRRMTTTLRHAGAIHHTIPAAAGRALGLSAIYTVRVGKSSVSRDEVPRLDELWAWGQRAAAGAGCGGAGTERLTGASATNHMTGSRAVFFELDSSVCGTVRFGDGSVVETEGCEQYILFACKTSEHNCTSSSGSSRASTDDSNLQLSVGHGVMRTPRRTATSPGLFDGATSL